MRGASILRAYAALISACALLGTACAPVLDEETEAETSGAAMTVTNGDRFVDRVGADEVVLKKEVDGVAFPFDRAGITGKAILVHPLPGKSETGIYARAVSVEETDTRYIVATRPLLFEDMENIDEDEVIRIYLNRSLATVTSPKAQAHPLVDPFALDTDVRPQGLSGLALGEPAVHGWVNVAPKVTVSGTFRAVVEDASLGAKPEIRLRYQRGRGLEIGARFDFDWSATIAMEGDVRGRGALFEPPKLSAPTAVVVVPIGLIPVPVTIGLSAMSRCWATGALHFKGKVSPDVRLSIGGSSFVKAASDPAEWLSAGEWPYQATGGATAKTDGVIEADSGASIDCWLPRLELTSKIVGLAGPHLALLALTSTTAQGTRVAAALRMGVRTEIFGKGAAVEVDVLSWAP